MEDSRDPAEGESWLSGQDCTTEVLDQSLYSHPNTRRKNTQWTCTTHTVPLTTGLSMAVALFQMQMSVSRLSLMYFCCVLGLLPPTPPPKIFQDVWNANKALLGRSFSALVKYLVWKLFQYLNEQVMFCRSISHDKKKSIERFYHLLENTAADWGRCPGIRLSAEVN